MSLSRPVVVGLVVLAVLLVGCVIAISVLAVRLKDETEKSSKNERAETETDDVDMSDCDDIAIIGAGITGSYAAWRLRDRNLKISMYEYSNRIGGRCFTVKFPDIPDVNVELGAMRFRPNVHPLLNKTVHELEMDVVDFQLGFGESGGSRYYLRGKHMKYEDLAAEAPYNMPSENRVERRTLYWNLYKKFTILSQDKHDLKSLDEVKLGDQTHKLFRNHHLKAIHKHKDGHYVLTFQLTETKAGITTDFTNRSPSKVCAKKVLLGIPRVALEHLDWDVLKEETIQDFIKNAVVDIPAGKMYFGYDNAWWRDLDLVSSYTVSTTPLRKTYDYAVSKNSSKAVLNLSYNDGDNRIWREALKFGDRVPGVGDNSIAMTSVGVKLARKHYAEVLNVTLDDVQEPNFAVMTIWDQYPIGAAWYAWAPGYNWDEVASRMIKPSANDDVYITSNVFSSNGKSGSAQGGMEIVEKVLKRMEQN